MKEKLDLKKLSILGVLIACEIILSRFLSIRTWNIKIGFAFIPIVLSAKLFGAKSSMAVALIADFLGAILFPIGPYFPGFTLTAALRGYVMGKLLYKNNSFLNISICLIISQVVLSLMLNTLWIKLLSGSPYKAIFIGRIPQQALMFILEFIFISLLQPVINTRIIKSIYLKS